MHKMYNRCSPPLQYLLSDKEIKVKTALWMAENSDYLKEQKGTFRMERDFCAGCVLKAEFNFYLSAGKCTFHSELNLQLNLPSLACGLRGGFPLCQTEVVISEFVCSDCFLFVLSEKEAKIAKEKELGIYKERKVTACSLQNI